VRIVPAEEFELLDVMRAELAEAFAVDLGGPSLTQQHLKDEADINVIMRRFGYTGALPVGAAGAVYGDFTGIESYEDAVDLVERSQRDFMALPANIRERFQNDPSRLVRFASEATKEQFEALFNRADVPGSLSAAQGAALPRPEAVQTGGVAAEQAGS